MGVLESVGRANQAEAAALSTAPEREVSGQYRGQTVTKSASPAAKLEDAAEELTFANSEKVETKLSKRKISGKAGIRTFAMELAQKYLEKVPDIERDKKLDDFAKKLLASGGRSPGQMRQSARQFSSDDTHQFLALSYAREHAIQEQADPEFIEAVEHALEQLQTEAGPGIQAGLNVSTVADSFAKTGLGDTQQLRDLYRDVVLDYGTARDAYGKIIAQHSDKEFPEAINFLLKSLAADMDANTQSLSKVQLKQVMDDMSQVKSLSSMYGQCENLLGRMRNTFSAVPDTADTHTLMTELLDAHERGWQGGEAFVGLPERMNIHDDDAKIYFLQGFKEIVRLTPLKVFDYDLVKRERLLQSVQESIDTVIDNEMEYE